jgi:lipopolysaccharide exporter
LSVSNKSIGLLSQCVRASGALVIGSLLDNFLRFVRNVILVRLLAPEAFGLMATLIAAVAATEAFTEVGFRQSVIQNKRGAEDDFLNVIWWLSTTRALGLYLITFALAPWIAVFFGKPDSVTLLRVGFIVLLFNGMVSPRLHVLEKELRFKNWVLLMQASGLAAIVISVASALILRNAWALVFGYIAEAFLKTTLSFIFYFFTPRLKFSRSCAREVKGFSRGMFGLPILMILFVQTDTFVVGKLLTVGVLGMYALAKDLADLPNKVFSKVSPLILPAFSIVQEDRTMLRGAVLTITQSIVTFIAPLLAFFIVFAKPILSLTYGSDYGTVAGPFAVLCGYSLLFICSSIIMNAYVAIGQPGIQRTAAAARTGLFIVLIYPAVKMFGLQGASIAMLMSMTLSLSVQLVFARPLLDMGLADYFTKWLPGISLSFFVIVFGSILSLLVKAGWLLTCLGGVLCVLSWLFALLRVRSVRSVLQELKASLRLKPYTSEVKPVQ